MQEVLIKIFSSIKQMGEEAQNMEMITEGKFYTKKGNKYILYKESEFSGMKGDNTLIKIEEKKISIKRYGNNFSEMVFEQGKRNVSNYSTPYGNFLMENSTKKLIMNIDENCNGIINIEYYLSIKNLSESFNKLKLSIKTT